MKTKSKTALVATFLMAATTAAMADSAPNTPEETAYLRSPNAPVPHFLTQAPASNGLIEGRNVGLGSRAAAPLSFEDVWINRDLYINSGD
ncbi:MAG TPA: hypothetical protein VFY21_13970 [Xanthobacteraceae bacterium]|nr:hypothetical protein [Xanthobacteraceae bacterium]